MKTIKISISKIKVDSKYFSFKFFVLVNGRIFDSGNYESSHIWNTKSKQSKFKKILKDYYAYDIVLENMNSLKSTPRILGGLGK